MGLVLSQKEQPLGLFVPLRSHASQGNVEPAGLQRVHLVGKGDDHAIPNTTDNEDSLRFPHGDVGNESLGSLFTNFPLCPGGFGLQLQRVVGEHRTPEAGRGVREHLDRGRRRLLIGARRPAIPRFFLDLDGVDPGAAVHVHDERVVRVGHVNLHLAERDVDRHANVHVGELGLRGEKHRAPLGQVPNGGIVEAVGLGGGVEAALGVHVELAVTLTTVHRCTIEGVFALCTLNK